jgi:ankyrin repeat protein
MRIVVTLLAWAAATYGGELHDAARRCDPDHLRRVLAARPPLNEADDAGMTPLHAAVDAGQPVCVSLLLEAGADRGAVDREGRSPLAAARALPAGEARTAILLRLMSRSGPGSPHEPSGSAPWSLEHSVLHRQTNVTKMLLQMGADPNATGRGGTTPLANAALKGDAEAVRALLAHGARVDAVSRTGTQPIHDAALGGSAEVVRALAQHGANVNARTRDDKATPLHVAAGMERLEAIKALLALGADTAARDAKGQTPLESAERVGLVEAVRLLRQATRAK